MNKQANIQKAIALMKSKGMSAEKALRAVYPDWDDAKIQKAAMTIRTMDKTAAVMQVSSAMAELEKTAIVTPALGGAFGYLKGERVGRGGEGAVKGALGAMGGAIGGGLLSVPLTVAAASSPKLAPLAIPSALLTTAAGAVLGYKGATSGVDKKRVEPVQLGGGKRKKAAADKKITFSPAMDKSPLLKGKQSKLPDQIQAKILKGKLKKEKTEKTAGVSITALKYASNAMYADQIVRKTGKIKEANWLMRAAGMPNVAGWAGKGAGLGGLIGGGGELARMIHLTTEAGGKAHLKNLAKYNKAVANSGKKGPRVMMPWQKAKAGKGRISAGNTAQADAKFLEQYNKLQKGGGFSKNPGEYVKLFAPSVLKNTAAGAAAGGVAGAGAGAVAKAHAKQKMINAAKTYGIPAAVGVGGLAVLNS